MIALKRNFNHGHFDEQGMVPEHSEDALQGLFYADVRLFKQYHWQLTDFQLLKQQTHRLHQFDQFWAQLSHHYQVASLYRQVKIDDQTMVDTLNFENHTDAPITLTLALKYQFDHQDLMHLRGIGDDHKAKHIEPMADGIFISYEDESQRSAQMVVQRDGVNVTALDSLSLTIGPKQKTHLEVRIHFGGFHQARSLPDYSGWMSLPGDNSTGTLRTPVNRQGLSDQHQRILQQSLDDLYGLLFGVEEGVLIAAGLPRFCAPFGRDSLLTSFFLLESHPQLAEGSLRWLARHAGTSQNPWNDENPGKILHEYRWGPKSQEGLIPFAPYFGAADSTPLFLILLVEFCQQTRNWALAEELSAAWRAAFDWLQNQIKSGRGFIRFRGNEAGLAVQGWKDSSISMVHKDGSLASGDIAVVEVQGYGVAALKAAAILFDRTQDQEQKYQALALAEDLNQRIQNQLWSDELQCYGLGLDGDDQLMEVMSSNVGHLLWIGCAPPERAAKVRDRLFATCMWSGWGFRTLADNEAGYNPVSYHNGSVWPHDTALVAWGLRNYGFEQDFHQVANAMMELAATQPDHRLPELVSGYPRHGTYKALEAPVPYPGTCVPQAWAAATLPFFYCHKKHDNALLLCNMGG